MPDREFKTRGEGQIGRDIENAMLAQTRLTDFAAASVLAIFAREAVAPELAQLYAAGLTIADAYYMQRPANSGTALDRRLRDFGLGRQDATTAYGVVTIYREAGTVDEVVIATGTRVGARAEDGTLIEFTLRGPVPAGFNPDIAGVVAGDTTLEAGISQVSAVVDAVLAGASGSVGAGAIIEWIDPKPVNVGAPLGGIPADGLTNLRAFSHGEDRASDNAARQLFFDWLTARPRCTPAALRIAATTYEQVVIVAGSTKTFRPVASAAVVEYLENPGAGGLAASVYVMGQSGQQVSDDVLDALQARIDGDDETEGWRAAGILVDVRRPNLLEAIVRVSLVGATDLQREQLRLRITSMISAIPIGGALKVAAIFGEVCKIGRLENATIILPEEDMPAGPTDKWIPAEVTVT